MIAKTTVVVASAFAQSRRHWSQKLHGTFAICEVAEGKALEQVMANLRPDVLVLDLKLPRLGRVRGLPRIQRLSPSTKMLILSNVSAESQEIAALKAGAKGFGPRAMSPTQIRKAVEVVQKGDVWVRRMLIPRLIAELKALTERRLRDPDQTPDRQMQGLTSRQRLVAGLIRMGACNKEIAKELNITERTVKAHLTGTFRQLGVSDRLELALLLNGLPHPRDWSDPACRQRGRAEPVDRGQRQHGGMMMAAPGRDAGLTPPRRCA
jgi:two-component system nitrate/nitrite response regulator NarL